MAYCTNADVYRVTGLASGGPVDDADITSNVQYAQAEVDKICQTTFVSTNSSGTATAGTATTLTDSTQEWDVDALIGKTVHITDGTGIGQTRKISDNTGTVLTVSVGWTTNPDTTTTFNVLDTTTKRVVRDGTGNDKLFLRHIPIINIEGLSVEGTSVTTTELYVYQDEGYIQLKDDAEVTSFHDTTPQAVIITYTHGVTPIPNIIVDYTAVIAGMSTLIEQIGGTYDDVTSYSLPELQASKGEPYTNIREALMRLIKKEERLRPLLPYFAHFG